MAVAAVIGRGDTLFRHLLRIIPGNIVPKNGNGGAFIG